GRRPACSTAQSGGGSVAVYTVLRVRLLPARNSPSASGGAASARKYSAGRAGVVPMDASSTVAVAVAGDSVAPAVAGGSVAPAVAAKSVKDPNSAVTERARRRCMGHERGPLERLTPDPLVSWSPARPAARAGTLRHASSATSRVLSHTWR